MPSPGALGSAPQRPDRVGRGKLILQILREAPRADGLIHDLLDITRLELETLGRCLSVSVAQGPGGTGKGVAGVRVLWDCNGSGAEQRVRQPNGTLPNPPSHLLG